MIPSAYLMYSDDTLYLRAYGDLADLLSSTTSRHSLIPAKILVDSIMRTVRFGLEIGAW